MEADKRSREQKNGFYEGGGLEEDAAFYVPS